MKHAWLFFLLISISVFYGQSSESDTVFLNRGTWITGVNGGINNSRTLNSGGTGIISGVSYSFAFNSGAFVTKRIALGVGAVLTKTGEVREEFASEEEQLFLGPWLRYYIPQGHRWYVYPEIGASYVNFYSELQNYNDATLDVVTARGFGVSPGVGIVFFMTKSAAFSVRWNYKWNIVSGDYSEVDNNGVETMSKISSYQYTSTSLLFGFQLYLNEFFF